MSAWDEICEEIRASVAGGHINRQTLFERIIEELFDQVEAEEVACERVRVAIEQAFAQKASAGASWPAITDCDRLRATFEALNARGIVAIENCEYTQQMGRARAIDLSLARDDAGLSDIGYCFFHEQDLQRAVDGGGLLLAYGALQEPEDAVGHEVANVIVDQLRAAGLAVEWSGSLDDRIALPAFDWRRRMPEAGEPGIREFLDSWELEIRAGVTSGDELADVLDERAAAWFESCADFGPTMLSRLHDHTAALLAAERALEATWTHATVNDRIEAAFESLRARGILALAWGGTTIQDGWAMVGSEATAEHRGAVFFHHEDLVDGVRGQGIHLAFGAFTIADSAVLGGEIVEALAARGVSTRWSGNASERIHVTPFAWQKRRWTAAPSIPSGPRAPTLLVTATPRSADRETHRRDACEIVCAPRSTLGFDLRRSGRLRAAWHAAGASSPGHACHIGLPFHFVRAGSYATMAAMSAIANLSDEATVLRTLRSSS